MEETCKTLSRVLSRLLQQDRPEVVHICACWPRHEQVIRRTKRRPRVMLRQRFRRRLTEAVADTVADPDQLEQELQHMLAVLGEDA